MLPSNTKAVLSIPNVVIEEKLDKGANGFVFVGNNKYLERKVAVKIWLKLRPKDERNKFLQGIDEVRKTDRAAGKTIRIYDAGEISGIFYAVMEYFEGYTLKKWLKQSKPCLKIRLNLAEEIIDSVYLATKSGIYHGDLHSKNILVSKNNDFRIIDFGTSFFSNKKKSLRRHFDLIYKTMAELLFPFDPLKTFPGKITQIEKYDIEWLEEIYSLFLSE